MPDNHTGNTAAWIVGGLTLLGALAGAGAVIFSSTPNNQQITHGANSPAINNTGGNVIINSPNQQEKKADD